MPGTLAEWLDYQQRAHTLTIDMGLDRVSEVWRRMGAPRPALVVITVGGTNGKGSTVAFLEAMLRAGGMRVGAYTSPHLLRYNERMRIDGMDADDDALIESFERIEAARSDVSLTYFEYGSLAAFDLFARARLDVALLEVGLGGRLDAVNLIDADCAVVTTVDLDHMEYLGNDREAIGHEKAGIFRKDRPAIIGERDPPRCLLDEALRIGAKVLRVGVDFLARRHNGAWSWAPTKDSDFVLPNLSTPMLAAPSQIDNAATAIAALYALREKIAWNPSAIARGIRETSAPGRLQRIDKHPELIVDVAHNPQAARELARWLDAHRLDGATHAVFGALADKDVAGIVVALGERIAHWHLAGLDADSPRGLTSAQLAERVRAAFSEVQCSEHATVAAAMASAREQAKPDGRILAFGSFFVAAAVLGTGRV
ncbi:MAG: bifunctional tetrahydrofolate synthase/dihydrofolate synthase [Pseudomonadota bacterium]|nr:bifunctional tetrahydrofolate synthase/dihydrofolate synthase [Pseudomonadota bacterium]